GLYVWFNIDETPVFAEEKARHVVPKAPLTQLLRRQRREIALAAGSCLAANSFGYTASTYLVNYAHTHLGYSRNVVLGVGMLDALAGMAFVALSATLSDRVGRRRMMLVGSAACLPSSLMVIPLIDTGTPICYAVAIIGLMAPASFGVGPTAAFIPELFATGCRYSGTALAANIASIGGALPPLIAGALETTYGSWAIGLMLATIALISMVCTYLLPETSGTTLSGPASRSSVEVENRAGVSPSP
ncbi:MAG: MFS transporter, partial [Mycobacterium sp.]|nr:MFS transporter [Mycobacterium sp.]